MTDETQIKDDLMYMSLTNGNHLVVCQGHLVKAKLIKVRHQRQPFLKRLPRALRVLCKTLMAGNSQRIKILATIFLLLGCCLVFGSL